MKIYLYDRQDAIKNGCYKNIHEYKMFLRISFLCIKACLILAIPFLIGILGAWIESWTLAYGSLIILLPIVFFLAVFGIPIIYSKDNKNCTIWLYRAIVKDENSQIYLVEQNNQLAARTFINEKDIFLKIFNKEREGIITELKNLKLIKETKKYYVCSYNDQADNNKIIKIAKAYKGLKEVL